MNQDSDYVSFGDVSRQRFGIQCQYGSRYVNRNFTDYPYLGEGLRIEGDPSNYHSLRIHKDDVEELVRRYKAATAEEQR